MHVPSANPTQEQSSSRKDPRAFVMTLAIVMFSLTCASMIFMQLAIKYGWQVL